MGRPCLWGARSEKKKTIKKNKKKKNKIYFKTHGNSFKEVRPQSTMDDRVMFGL